MTPPPRRRSRLQILVFLISLLANAALIFWFVLPSRSTENHYAGDPGASDKIAIIRINGILIDGTTAWPISQIEAAAKDPKVKAVVLRIDSPGGTVTASEELYRCLLELRDATGRRWTGTTAKPIVTSMGGVAASGGYYLSVVGSPVLAEQSTITGSIGVFAALPNASELGDKHGFKVELIKAGGIKASGSTFHALTPAERQPWQDMVDSAYEQFLGVIAKERPRFTVQQLKTEIVVDKSVPYFDSKGNPLPPPAGSFHYTRVRADGGTMTPQQAKDCGLIDQIGDLPAAVKIAAEKANLAKYRAISYQKPKSLTEQLIGIDLGVRTEPPGWPNISLNLTPRLWFLSPHADLAGMLATGP